MRSLLILLLFSACAYAQSNWEALDSPGGADINTIFKVTDSVYLIGIQEGSLYRSTDSGNYWEKVFTGYNFYSNKSVRCFIFTPAGEILSSTFDDGILRSTDYGLTWIPINSKGGEIMVNTESGIMFGCDNSSSNSLTKSLDSGKTWQFLPHPWSSGSDKINSMTSVGNTLYLGFGDSILYTNDFGITWIKFGNSFPAERIYSILFFNEYEILTGTDNGIYYSSDAGVTWNLRNSGIPGYSKLIRKLQLVSDRVYAAGNSGLLYSTNKGLEWKHYNNYNFQIDIYEAAFSSNKILIASQAGVFKLVPEDWLYSSDGIYHFQPRKILQASNGNILYNSSAGLFNSTDNGISWKFIDLEKFYGGCKDIAIKNNFYFTHSQNDPFYISSDHGVNWVKTGDSYYYNQGMFFSTLDNSILASFFYHPPANPPINGFFWSADFGAHWTSRNHDNLTLIANSGNLMIGWCHPGFFVQTIGLKKSDNQGYYWEQINTGLPDTNVKCISFDINKEFYSSISGGIYKFNQGNNIWHQFSTLSPEELIFNKLNHLVVLKGGEIYASVNGKHWNFCSMGLEGVSISKILMDSLGYYYLAGNNGRLYKSITPHIINQLPSKPELLSPINYQQVRYDTVEFSWTSSSPLVINYMVNIAEDSLFNSFIDTLVTDTSLILTTLENNKIYYWRVKVENELGWGEFSYTHSFTTALTGIEEDPEKVYKYSLSQNYPNPFNPSTRISFELAAGNYVLLKVYDILGRELITLVDEEKPAGMFEIEFNGTNLPSGVYIYKFQAGEFNDTKKLLLMK